MSQSMIIGPMTSGRNNIPEDCMLYLADYLGGGQLPFSFVLNYLCQFLYKGHSSTFKSPKLKLVNSL